MRSRVLNILKAVARFLLDSRKTIAKVILVIALVLVAAIPAVLDNTVIGYAPILMVVAGILLSGCYLLALKQFVSFDQDEAVQVCRRGEPSDIGVTVRNDSFLLCPRVEVDLYISDLKGEVDSQAVESFSLLPKETRKIELTARFDHIGRYKVGLRSITIYDFFGLFKHSFKTNAPQTVEVEPRIVDPSHLDVVHRNETDVPHLNRSTMNEGFDYIGMRDYVLGDTMRSIHWKASARYESLMTRLYERQINPDLSVIVDSSTRWSSGEDLMCVYDAVIESTLSLANYASEQGIECTVITTDASGEPVDFLARSSWGYDDLMDAVPLLSASEENEDTALLVHKAFSGLYSSGNIIVCTSNPTDRLLSEIISAYMAGKHVWVLVAHPATWERDEESYVTRKLSRLSAVSIPFIVMSDAKRLEGVRA